jgi:hypothetical protein
LQAFAGMYPGGVAGLAQDGVIAAEGPGVACRGNG